MSEVNFGAGATPVETVTTPPASTPPAMSVPAVTGAALPAVRGPAVLGDLIPDFSDIILPRLNIVQNIGGLKDSFRPGSIVFGRQVPIFIPGIVDVATSTVKEAGTKPATITVLGFWPTRFCEKIAGGARGLIVNTEQEVRENGGTLNYQEWNLKKASGMKRFEQYADALTLVERPEHLADDGTIFVFECEGKKYALARFGMKGTIYTAAAKGVFFTARLTGCLKAGGYPSFHYYVSTKLQPWPGGNSSFIPVCVSGSRSSPAFLDFVADILGQPTIAQKQAAVTTAEAAATH